MATGTDNDYITPHRQNATYEPEDENPPPIVKRPNMECSKEPVKSWADYEDDEPLPEVIFGKKMEPCVVENLTTNLILLIVKTGDAKMKNGL